MSRYGCHNKPRPVLGAPLDVQDGHIKGLFSYDNPAISDRVDRIVQVPFVMSTDCQYTKAHMGDRECSGCVHRAKEAA